MNEVKGETIRKMEEQRAKLSARIQLLKNRKRVEERKQDTRRKILVGAYFIKTMDGDLQGIGQCLADAGFLEERDRPLFGLPSISK